MSSQVYTEEQKFRRWDVFFFLGFFIVGLSYSLIKRVFFVQEADITSIITLLLLIGGLAFAFWYLWNLKVRIKVNEKRVSLSSDSLFSGKKKQKIKWKDVEGYKFIKASPAAEMSGWGVRYKDAGRVIGFCGETGLYIFTKDGSKILICSKKIIKIKEKLESMFAAKKMKNRLSPG